jgi:hypothetical protein
MCTWRGRRFPRVWGFDSLRKNLPIFFALRAPKNVVPVSGITHIRHVRKEKKNVNHKRKCQIEHAWTRQDQGGTCTAILNDDHLISVIQHEKMPIKGNDHKNALQDARNGDEMSIKSIPYCTRPRAQTTAPQKAQRASGRSNSKLSAMFEARDDEENIPHTAPKFKALNDKSTSEGECVTVVLLIMSWPVLFCASVLGSDHLPLHKIMLGCRGLGLLSRGVARAIWPHQRSATPLGFS